MKPAPFAYARPRSWSDALTLLADGARPGAGTQSLGPLLNLRLAHADPAGDWVAVLPALGATAIALGPRGERRVPAAEFVTGIFETALAADELLRAIEVPLLPADARWGHWKFCRKPGEFSKATACVLVLPDQPPRAVLAALDAPPLVIDDASMLLIDPAGQAPRFVETFPGLTPWRRAVAQTALRRAVAIAGPPLAAPDRTPPPPN